MEDLESRINEELTTLKEQLSNIDANLSKFSNVEELKGETEEKRNKLIMEQADLADIKTELQMQVTKLQEECDQLEVFPSNFLMNKLFTEVLYVRLSWIKTKLMRLFAHSTKN